jgi:hypothetical protein
MAEVQDIMNNTQWEAFAKGELVNFLVAHHLQKISVDDGAQKKASVKINSKGEVLVNYSATDRM